MEISKDGDDNDNDDNDADRVDEEDDGKDVHTFVSDDLAVILF